MDLDYIDNIRNQVIKRSKAISILEKNKTINFKVLKNLSFELFDDKEYKSDEHWNDVVSTSTIENKAKAHALHLSNETFYWKACIVERISRDQSEKKYNYYDIRFLDDSSGSMHSLHRIFICFDKEDINSYCDRFCEVVDKYEICRESLSLNLYVDCMPVDGLKGFDSEQVTRILKNSLNMPFLRADATLDSSSLLQQYNLCHMRTSNKLCLINLIEKQNKSVSAVNPYSMNAKVIKNLEDLFPHRNQIITIPNFLPLNFQDNKKAFHVTTLWNKSENAAILFQLQIENLKIENSLFSAVVEKTLRVDEFETNQNVAVTNVTQAIREQWPLAIINSVKLNLQNIKKVSSNKTITIFTIIIINYFYYLILIKSYIYIVHCCI